MTIRVPEYELYGEQPAPLPRADGFWIHCEAISDRSRLHGWVIRPHRHRRFIQILYIWSGAGEILLPGGAEAIRVPAVVEVPRDRPHGFRFTHDVQGFVLSVVPERLRLVTSVDAVRQTPLPPHDRAAVRLDRMLREIEIEYRMHDRGEPTVLAAIVDASRAMIERLRRPTSMPACGSGSEERDRRRVAALKILIATHFRAHPPVGFYAAELQVSASQLNRICRRQAGLNVRELIAAHVIEEACRSLVFTMLSVKQIGYNLGFSDPAYFTRFFLRQTGCRPTDYRRERPERIFGYEDAAAARPAGT
ncbi:MAG: helix-turn-helix domain-containing protein [Pararhizobium sp.]